MMSQPLEKHKQHERRVARKRGILTPTWVLKIRWSTFSCCIAKKLHKLSVKVTSAADLKEFRRISLRVG